MEICAVHIKSAHILGPSGNHDDDDDELSFFDDSSIVLRTSLAINSISRVFYNK